MQATLFLRNKIERQIKMNGQSFVVERYDIDDRRQQLDTKQNVVTFAGIFHEAIGYVKPAANEAGVIKSKPQPMIMTLIDEESQKIQEGDIVQIGTCTYKVTSKKDIKQLGVVYDISLEVEV